MAQEVPTVFIMVQVNSLGLYGYGFCLTTEICGKIWWLLVSTVGLHEIKQDLKTLKSQMGSWN